MTIRVIDIETTGTDPLTDKVIEIASVDLDRDGGYTNALTVLCDPGIPIPAQASAVHHLIDDDVRGHAGYETAIGAFKGATAYVAHNAKFEIGFVGANIGCMIWVCTYKCALRLWPDLPQHSNQFLRYHFGLLEPCGVPRTEVHPHRALSDCIVTAAILHKMLDAGARWTDLVAWSSSPALFTTINFGKHFGKRYDEVPVDYLEWMARQPDMDADKVFSAKHWLNAKKAAA